MELWKLANRILSKYAWMVSIQGLLKKDFFAVGSCVTLILCSYDSLYWVQLLKGDLKPETVLYKKGLPDSSEQLQSHWFCN